MAEEKKKKQAKAKSDDAKQAKSGKGDKAKSGESKGKKDEVAKVQVVPKDYVPRLRKMYFESVVSEMTKKFSYDNRMLVPKLDKIVLNVGIGTLHSDAKLAESIADELTMITGQKPVLTKARKSIANFKLRDGMIVGCRVTLRHHHMYEFLDRLITIVIPRIRDFRGLSDRSFDGRGNYTFGIKEQIIFPEIDYDKVVQMHGMDLTITTSAKTDEEAQALLKFFGFPFRQRTVNTEGKAA